MKKTKSSGNLFKDVGFSATESKKLQFRSFLMVTLMKYVENEGLSQREAAERFGITTSRMSNLAHCKVDLFSTDMLLDMLERVGFKVYEKLKVTVTLNAPKNMQRKKNT